MQITHR